jgi:hypothetical protein
MAILASTYEIFTIEDLLILFSFNIIAITQWKLFLGISCGISRWKIYISDIAIEWSHINALISIPRMKFLRKGC